MGFFGNKNNDDDLKKRSKKSEVEEKEESDEDEEEEESEDGPCSVDIYTTNSDDYLTVDGLTTDQLKELKSKLNEAMNENSLLDLSDFGYNFWVNGKFISKYSWEEEDE